MNSLVLLRHGQSAWNESNRFTGWTDVDLTGQGVEEARLAGRYLHESGFWFDIAFTSLLKRAIRSLWIVLDETEQMWLPVHKTWLLNERHYGMLQGLDKAETAAKYGAEQVFHWRRSYHVQPPPLGWDDPRHPRFDPRYSGIHPADLPATESLENAQDRVLLCWNGAIMPQLRQGKKVLVVAHGNSLRALIKFLDNIPAEEVAGLSVPLGIPIVYDLDQNHQAVSRSYLGDEEVVRVATEAASRASQVTGS
jgi:2,3-bisphosphoglycerate-dependent phosphoglycerate mutase